MKPYVVLMAVMVTTGALKAAEAAEQPYPSRPVRVIVGLAPGGGTDTVGRVLIQKLSDVLGQSFVVDNRPSAGGNVAGELVARATPDGHTLLIVTPTHVVNPSLYRDLRYDALRDFAAVALIVYSQYYLSVSNASGLNSVGELLAAAKSRPQPLSYASSGIGSANHLSGELLKTMTGINLVHVPYKGGAPALNALIANEVQVSFTSFAALPHAKAGRIKTIAVTGSKRTPIAPNIPTIGEAGVPGYEVVGWYGLAAPAKTPKPVIQRLNSTVNGVLPELRERYENLGMDLGGGGAEEFGAFLRTERDKWARVVKASGAKVE
ncbi:MAG TPA: tripartite tricarboxylate transporter substrate binding protein [Burkholderiales bacterium]|nr:tripartite tricarboxylate transporter substrate binding protein [Burkholderiales bacterium]